ERQAQSALPNPDPLSATPTVETERPPAENQPPIQRAVVTRQIAALTNVAPEKLAERVMQIQFPQLEPSPTYSQLTGLPHRGAARKHDEDLCQQLSAPLPLIDIARIQPSAHSAPARHRRLARRRHVRSASSVRHHTACCITSACYQAALAAWPAPSSVARSRSPR